MRGLCYRLVYGEIYSFLTNKFNQIDILVISLDALIFAIGAILGKGAKFTKVLRILRLIRLVRLLRAAKLINKILTNSLSIYKPWKMPIRYATLPQIDIDTVVSMLKALQAIQVILEDRYITALLLEFQKLEVNENSIRHERAFLSVCDQITSEAISNDENDNILIDFLMYGSGEVVQNSLEVLMTHHSARSKLLANLEKVQLLVSSKREKQYVKVEICLGRLKRDADTHSMWCKLKTDENRQIASETLTNLRELIALLRKRRSVLFFDEDFEADPIIQDLIRNLGGMKVALTFFHILSDLDQEDTISEAYKNTMTILSCCSEMFYWFIVDNVENQMNAFEYLDLFVAHIDMRIGFHKIILAIFKNNLNLMKMVSSFFFSLSFLYISFLSIHLSALSLSLFFRLYIVS